MNRSISWNAAQQIMKSAVERGLASPDLDEVPHVGIDEKNFGKGHDYVSVMTDIDGGRVLEVAPGRTRESADSLWNTLSEEQKEDVEAVAIDMWPAFLGSAEERVPQADVVHDRFHIAKHLGEAVDRVRRGEQKSLKKEGDERLTGSRYMWLSNPENLSEQKAASFEELKRANLKTSRAWAIREQFREFWSQIGPFTGAAFFHDWYAWASRSRLKPIVKRLKPIVKTAKMLKRHLDRILTWFRHRISNATALLSNRRILALLGQFHQPIDVIF